MKPIRSKIVLVELFQAVKAADWSDDGTDDTALKYRFIANKIKQSSKNSMTTNRMIDHIVAKDVVAQKGASIRVAASLYDRHIAIIRRISCKWLLTKVDLIYTIMARNSREYTNCSG